MFVVSSGWVTSREGGYVSSIDWRDIKENHSSPTCQCCDWSVALETPFFRVISICFYFHFCSVLYVILCSTNLPGKRVIFYTNLPLHSSCIVFIRLSSLSSGLP